MTNPRGELKMMRFYEDEIDKIIQAFEKAGMITDDLYWDFKITKTLMEMNRKKPPYERVVP